MTDPDIPFADHYATLRVHPACEPKALDRAYHTLAKRYHPDRSGTADTHKFDEVTKAYKLLRDTTRRAQYDRDHARHTGGGSYFAKREEVFVEEQGAIDDADAHDRILIYLYNKRRDNAQSPGVIGFYIQDMLGCSHEHFEFHKWYLKEKGFISLTEQGEIAITIAGVDQVISTSRTTRTEKLRISQDRREQQ